MSSRRNDDGAGPSSAAPPAAETSVAAMSEDEAEEAEASSGGDEEDDAEAGSGEEGVRKQVSCVSFGCRASIFSLCDACHPSRHGATTVQHVMHLVRPTSPPLLRLYRCPCSLFPHYSIWTRSDVDRLVELTRALFTQSCCPNAG